MKLIGSYTSPYVRKVRISLIEKGLEAEFINDPPWEVTTHVPDFNPLGKVPALVTDAGDVLFDSNILLDYLELQGGAVQLYPADKRDALVVRQLVTLADGVCDAGVAIVVEGRRPAEKQVPDWVARQLGKIDRGLAALERQATNREFLFGNALSAADVATGCMLLWLDFRLPQFEWRSKHPALTALTTRLSQRDSFSQTIPKA
ncbi:MAG: glutathione S-transferase [Rhodocyclaceae bacterium]